MKVVSVVAGVFVLDADIAQGSSATGNTAAVEFAIFSCFNNFNLKPAIILKMADEEKIIPLDRLVLKVARQSDKFSREAKEATKKNLPRVAGYLTKEVERLADQSQGLYQGTLPPEKRKETTKETSNAASDASSAEIIPFRKPKE